VLGKAQFKGVASKAQEMGLRAGVICNKYLPKQVSYVAFSCHGNGPLKNIIRLFSAQ